MKTFSVIDIETLQCTDDRLCEYLTSSVKADSRLKDPAKIEADKAEKRESVISRSGLDGGFGMLAMIGLTGVNTELGSMVSHQYCNESSTLEGERELLRQFWDDAYKLHTVDPSGQFTSAWTDLVGHNVRWDLRFIMQRTVVHGLGMLAKPSLFDLNSRYSQRVHCTMEMWAGYGERISLDRLCTILGVESPKSEFDGSKVHELWTSGKEGQDKVKQYNLHDLIATAQCFIKMRECGL